MPSIQDIADQINAKLEQIRSNTAVTASNTGDIATAANAIRTGVDLANVRLDAIETTLQVGFVNISQGIFSILEVERASLVMLDHHRQQHDTIICELTHANELLCDIKRKFARQLELSESLVDSVDRIEGVVERVHAEAAGDYDRLETLEGEIHRCCPPEPPAPEPCPEPCERPKFRPPAIDGDDWRPLPVPPTRDGPNDRRNIP